MDPSLSIATNGYSMFIMTLGGTNMKKRCILCLQKAQV